MITPIIRQDAQDVAASLAEILKPLEGRTLLVAGAGGFLGSFFLDVISAFNRDHAATPCKVVATDNFKVGLPDRIRHLDGMPGFTFIRHDISQPMALDQAPDYIIHAAGIGSPIFYRSSPLETIAVNVEGTRHMLDLCRRGGRSMISFSSSEIYGDPEPGWVPTPEHYRGYVSCTGPRACYDESKRLGETLCVTYHRQFGTPVKVIRPFNVFGPGQRIDDGRIIPDLMKAAMAGGPLVLLSDGSATRSFCYVADFVRGCLMVLMSDADGEIFNVGNDREIAIRDVAQMVAEVAADPPLTVEFHKSPDADYLVDNPQRRCPDLTKLRTEMNWAPRVDLREGLRRTLQSYRQQQEVMTGGQGAVAAPAAE